MIVKDVNKLLDKIKNYGMMQCFINKIESFEEEEIEYKHHTRYLYIVIDRIYPMIEKKTKKGEEKTMYYFEKEELMLEEEKLFFLYDLDERKRSYVMGRIF